MKYNRSQVARNVNERIRSPVGVRQFLDGESGRTKACSLWRDRESQTTGSINQNGPFPTDLMGIREVKDETEFRTSGLLTSGQTQQTSGDKIRSRMLWQCQKDMPQRHTFVPFYPTLSSGEEIWDLIRPLRAEVISQCQVNAGCRNAFLKRFPWIADRREWARDLC